MPRQKRTFSKVDSNASQPSSRKASKNMMAAADKINTEDLSSKTNAEESTGCSNIVDEESRKVRDDVSSNNIEYMTMCRPFEDIGAEKRANEEDFDSEEGEEINSGGADGCMCKKPLEDHPEWKWIISKQGFETIKHMQLEAMHRDQDYMDQYHYNDFSGYGFQEAVNNQLQAFHKEYTKKNPNPLALWYLITGFAHVLPGPGAWYMCDDSQQIAATIRLLGYAILATGDVLKRKDLVKPDSEIKDLSLVLAMCLKMVGDWDEFAQEDELGWRVPVINLAEANGVKLSGPFGIEDHVAKLKEEYNGEEAAWIKFDWKKKFVDFARKYSTSGGNKIGGTHYDLSKSKGKKGGMMTTKIGETF